ncbi:hypothetical protein [Oenococcus oeni]|uniref:Uncharacterized protein n=1 Tax=Oenococcus oeni TaxID=1247 RepID=A0AAQ2ZE19_OENOE|nr:hypothetical protein [Oenococcus oeni]EJN99839.1 hypothetical protein AWRIB418_1574 [Oenococcus oeni AWRIB418]KEP87909.1 hypothetical protein X279_05325 [Oenococcus oeni IOEB_0501]USO99948.1 hypothetical protein LOD97_02045 [Oenococcus oeni]WOC54414.1 hypothetical protein RMT25_01900 [Oenococcus oeni]SYW06620.1 hypothetical protein OENI_310010 [Oenococcus oeni]
MIVNGATGFAGKLAIQVAKQLGVKNIIAAGRNKKKIRGYSGFRHKSIVGY